MVEEIFGDSPDVDWDELIEHEQLIEAELSESVDVASEKSSLDLSQCPVGLQDLTHDADSFHQPLVDLSDQVQTNPTERPELSDPEDGDEQPLWLAAPDWNSDAIGFANHAQVDHSAFHFAQTFIDPIAPSATPGRIWLDSATPPNRFFTACSFAGSLGRVARRMLKLRPTRHPFPLRMAGRVSWLFGSMLLLVLCQPH